MFGQVIFLGVLSCVYASAVDKRASGSTFAGASSSAIYPPPNATNTGAAFTTYFPDASEVGYAGPTPTGDEAEAVATAPVNSPMDSIFPLTDPEAENQSSDSSFDVVRHWGNLSPWYSVPADSFGLPDASPQIPEGCGLTQAYLLHRHGARYPTSDSGPATFATALQKAATGAGFSASGPLEFLNTWTYRLGAELLTPFGREELFNLGVGFRVKYGDLLKGFADLPVFRTTSQARMVDSALHFAAGFFGVQSYQTDYHQLIIAEEDGFNNTLSPWTVCPNGNNDIYGYGTNVTENWVGIYLKNATERLQQYIKGVNLTTSDVYAMQSACPYETVALGFSEFCSLFTEEEWAGFEYAWDLDFWYSSGPGNPASAAQGLGWVQELVARLTQTPFTGPTTSTNFTLDGNNVTFPLNQPIYVDATHDTVISTILTTMNFTSLAAEGPLPLDHIPENHTYLVSRISPFATNLVGQVLSCPASSTPTHIRWILNDAVLPLTGVSGCSEDADGLCEIDSYISGIKERIEQNDYEFDCYANYTIPQPDEITDGRYPDYLKNGTSARV